MNLLVGLWPSCENIAHLLSLSILYRRTSRRRRTQGESSVASPVWKASGIDTSRSGIRTCTCRNILEGSIGFKANY